MWGFCDIYSKANGFLWVVTILILYECSVVGGVGG